MKIDKWDPKKDGVLNERSLRKKLEKKGYHVSLYQYPPGTFFSDHTHAIDKIDAVLSGEFEMGMLGKKVVLKAGDSLAVPRGTVHNARVVGNQPVVSLDATKE